MSELEEGNGHETRLFQRSKPTNDTGIYLFQHEHDWFEIGAERFPKGSWHPVFRCGRCGDVICDLSVSVDEPKEGASA